MATVDGWNSLQKLASPSVLSLSVDRTDICGNGLAYENYRIVTREADLAHETVYLLRVPA